MSGNNFEQVVIFQDLSPSQIALVRPLFQPSYEPAGSEIFEQGDLAEFLYILVDGEVNIRYKPEDGPVLNVTRVHPGGVVGWSAALGNPVYTSSATCLTDCQMLRVRGQDLRQLCEQHPETGSLILERLAAVIAERLRNTHQQVMALLEQGLRVDMNKSVATGL